MAKPAKKARKRQSLRGLWCSFSKKVLQIPLDRKQVFCSVLQFHAKEHIVDTKYQDSGL